MSTNIECTKCGDMIAIEADTVVLPFVCFECEAAIDKFGTDLSGDSVATENTDLTEDFATVENTTLLIADLEAQLANTQRLIESAEAQIKNLQDKNETQAKTIASYENDIDSLIVKLGYSNAHILFLRESVNRLGNVAVELREEVNKLKLEVLHEKNTASLNKVCTKIAQSASNAYAEKLLLSQQLVTSLREENAVLNSKRDFWRDEAIDLGKELHTLTRPWYEKLRDWWSR